MRSFCFFAGFLLWSVSLLVTLTFAQNKAGEIKLKVVDPQDAVVSGAQVRLFELGKSAPVEVLNTSAEGTVAFHTAASGKYRVRVLAPGFAAQTIDLSPKAEPMIVKLQIASASETLVVSATRTPVASEASGSQVNSLSAAQIETMQPIGTDDALRFLPGAIIGTTGQHGGLASLFVRGGDSTYNKVIVDGVPLDNPGLTFDFGTLPLTEADRLEFVRGAQSTLYGSDAMTSVVQVWTRTGSTPVPELRFGADGGNFGTANGYGSLSGTYRRFDYNFFGNQFNTQGQGVNDAYSNSLEGANVGAALTDTTALRIRFRHANSYTGVPGEWNFNGDPLLDPNPSEWSHQNNLLGSVELAVNAPSGWQHRITAYDSLYRYTDTNLNSNGDIYNSYPDRYVNHDNRVGFEYQGDYSERDWAHTTFGYRVQNETGFVNDQESPPEAPGQRLDQDAYLQQQLTLGRLSAIAGGRFVHSSTYGNTGMPRVAFTLLALRGGELFSGTRLRFSYATGFMEPALYEVFGEAGYGYTANPGLLPERTRAFEAGIQQNFLSNRWSLNATYFNNLFHDQITAEPAPKSIEYEFFNIAQSFAQGAEVEIQGKVTSRISFTTAYTYTSTEILKQYCTTNSPCTYPDQPGDPLLRRPKQAGTMLVSYLGHRWGANLGGAFVGRRPDDAYLFTPPNFTYAAGYARVDLGGWYAIHPRITAYVSVQNALDAHYNEVVGYPALTANFRAGLRFRIGGE